ncbi:SusD family protein [Pedobacter steynii]|uniref:SusD family protein n=1 Tax=Pedobacter steynii TaxID=430522 RepID=A0A1G9UEF5_9SPHI|nr:RagB/SusD family nutrient uptake outer membrane protein [Pedobacter steynii]NQX40746.1 RagB/SusD family nutrient uptake outer membrane protein [Pedobacter steynii]SDM58330.1 SusD family protein [Pedobacter steynii]
MKNIQKISLILFIAIAPLASCKKFLEADIDNRTSLDQLKDLEKAIIAIEPGSDHHFTDFMTDDYVYKDIAGHVVRDANEKIKPLFTFEILKNSVDKNQMFADGLNPNSAFLRYYFRINNANLLISKAEELKSAKAGEAARLNNVIAHAKSIKAYCNFMLANLFGKQYDAATAATDLAAPYIGEYNSKAIVNRPRASVKLLYDEVEKDWLSALELMDDKNPFFNSKFYFSKRAIYGLLSRLYLNKKEWDNATKYADLAVQADALPLNIAKIRGGTQDPDLFSKTYFDPVNPSYLMMGNNTYQLLAYFFSGYYPYTLSSFMLDQGGHSGTIRTSPLYDDIIMVKFVYFSTQSNRNMNMPLITVDEALFNRAEAQIEKNQLLNDVAKADLLSLINNQSMQYTPDKLKERTDELEAANTKEKAISLLLKIKRMRFGNEGMRWFDIKRHQLPVTHNMNGTDYKLTGTNANEYVIKMPLEEIQFNKDVQ